MLGASYTFIFRLLPLWCSGAWTRPGRPGSSPATANHTPLSAGSKPAPGLEQTRPPWAVTWGGGSLRKRALRGLRRRLGERRRGLAGTGSAAGRGLRSLRAGPGRAPALPGRPERGPARRGPGGSGGGPGGAPLGGAGEPGASRRHRAAGVRGAPVRCGSPGLPPLPPGVLAALAGGRRDRRLPAGEPGPGRGRGGPAGNGRRVRASGDVERSLRRAGAPEPPRGPGGPPGPGPAPAVHAVLGDVALCLALVRDGGLAALRSRRRDRSEGEGERLLAEAAADRAPGRGRRRRCRWWCRERTRSGCARPWAPRRPPTGASSRRPSGPPRPRRPGSAGRSREGAARLLHVAPARGGRRSATSLAIVLGRRGPGLRRCTRVVGPPRGRRVPGSTGGGPPGGERTRGPAPLGERAGRRRRRAPGPRRGGQRGSPRADRGRPRRRAPRRRARGAPERRLRRGRVPRPAARLPGRRRLGSRPRAARRRPATLEKVTPGPERRDGEIRTSVTAEWKGRTR